MIQIKTICDLWECRCARRGGCAEKCLVMSCSGFSKCFNCAKLPFCNLINQNYSYKADLYEKCYIDFVHAKMLDDFEHEKKKEQEKKEEEEKLMEQIWNSFYESKKNIKKMPKFDNLEAFYKWLSREEKV